jgi:hypothetical protein
MTELIRLILTPDLLSQQISTKAASFIAVLESTGDFVVNSHQPLADGARELLARGFDPATPLTMRHAGKAYDSFEPMPIGQWAKVTYTEPDKESLRLRNWRPHPGTVPFAAVPEGPKSTSEPSGGTRAHPEDNSLPATDRGGK